MVPLSQRVKRSKRAADKPVDGGGGSAVKAETAEGREDETATEEREATEERVATAPRRRPNKVGSKVEDGAAQSVRTTRATTASMATKRQARI